MGTWLLLSSVISKAFGGLLFSSNIVKQFESIYSSLNDIIQNDDLIVWTHSSQHFDIFGELYPQEYKTLKKRTLRYGSIDLDKLLYQGGNGKGYRPIGKVQSSVTFLFLI
jgi:hypothetical protein